MEGSTPQLPQVGQVQAAGQDAVCLQAALDGIPHGLPDLLEILPERGPFQDIDQLKNADFFLVAESDDLREILLRVDFPVLRGSLVLNPDRPASNTEDADSRDLLPALEGPEKHRVRMGQVRLRDLTVKNDFCSRQTFPDRLARAVPLAGEGQGPIQGDFIGIRVRIAAAEGLGRVIRSYRVGTGGTITDLIDTGYAFHIRWEAPFLLFSTQGTRRSR